MNDWVTIVFVVGALFFASFVFCFFVGKFAEKEQKRRAKILSQINKFMKDGTS